MGKSIVDITRNHKKIRGRKPTPRGRDLGTPVMVRLSAEELAQLDAWIGEQRENLGIELSRPAAIRARLNISEPPTKPRRKRNEPK
jgi:hypothetical protein